ncbi:MAG: Ada metal-binding domain-containing protein [Patescibacteria group bacterium]|nr:Ada metal-binding domain-containing protein [bacterium]MDZ4227253.1 Ada metal-binding domain-containing protein [Patescibacteria group bacterium]
MNIQEYKWKIKAAYEAAVGDWGLVVVVMLVGLISFGLGRLSAFEDVRPPVSIQKAPEQMKPRGAYLGALFVASRAGRVYYFPWCSGAANIAPANQRWFQSEEEARAAGYTPSKSCRGLE